MSNNRHVITAVYLNCISIIILGFGLVMLSKDVVRTSREEAENKRRIETLELLMDMPGEPLFLEPAPCNEGGCYPCGTS